MRPFRYPYHNEDGVRSVERMSSILEVTEYSNSRSALASRSTRRSVSMWPFHHRGPSAEIPSTARSSRAGPGGRLRSGTWNSRTYLQPIDDAASIDQNIVPDYVINFMKGETPESLAQKKEAKQINEGATESNPQDSLSHFFDFVDPGSPGFPFSIRDAPGGVRKFLTGWRGGVLYNTVLTFIIFIVGIAYMGTVLSKADRFSAQVAIFSGNCAKATRIKIGTSTVINVFGIVLLAGANYVFQVLSSPRRSEISKAHDKKRWLDIGVSSLRNLAYISRPRAMIASLILLLAVAMHVVYNAVIVFTPSEQDHCSVSVNSATLIIAVILNFVLCIAMASVLVSSLVDPLATLGDAIRSFLQIPDSTTVNASLLNKTDLRKGQWGPNATKRCEPRNHYWLEGPSLTRWVLTILSWLAVGGPTAAAVALLGKASSKGVHPPFGTPTADMTFSFSSPAEPAQLALVTALSQVLLAILYLSTNALLSTYYVSHELALFAIGPYSLRVSSDPAGTQVASLYLSLPRPVSWLLLLTFAALGLVLSQAVFTVLPTSGPKAAVAFNPQALLVLIAMLLLILGATVALGLRRTPNPALANSDNAVGNPLALCGGVNSALISARSHAWRGEGSLWLKPVAWGVVEEATESRPGRCAFASNPIAAFDMGMEYA